MKVASIVWSSHVSMLVQASKKIDWIELKLFSSRTLDSDPSKYEEALQDLKEADLILLYRSSEHFWEIIERELEEIGQIVPIICVSHDPSFWEFSTVDTSIVQRCYDYITIGGEENFARMLCYLAHEVLNLDVAVEPPGEVPWEGIYHPQALVPCFPTIEEYTEWYRDYAENKGIENAPTVGILFARHYWVNKNLAVEDYLIEELEKLGCRVIPVFSYNLKDSNLGTKGSAQVIEEVFFSHDNKPVIDALIKLQAFFLGSQKGDNLSDPRASAQGSALLKKLGVPVFQPDRKSVV